MKIRLLVCAVVGTCCLVGAIMNFRNTVVMLTLGGLATLLFKDFVG